MREWLHEYRMSAGLSQKEMARASGITHQFYNYLENDARNPSNKVAKRIASVLGFE